MPWVTIAAMDPYQSPQPSQQNPYDFITNPGGPAKQPRLGGGSLKTRLLVVIGGLLALMILGSVVATVLSSSGRKDTTALKNLAAQQQELIRVAELGADKAVDYKTRSLAYTAKLSVTTQQQKLLAYLSGRGITVTKEELAAKKQSSIDKDLDSAAANNRFDEVFSATLDEELQDYATAMKTIYDSITSEKTKEILSESYTSSVTLIGTE